MICKEEQGHLYGQVNGKDSFASTLGKGLALLMQTFVLPRSKVALYHREGSMWLKHDGCRGWPDEATFKCDG